MNALELSSEQKGTATQFLRIFGLVAYARNHATGDQYREMEELATSLYDAHFVGRQRDPTDYFLFISILVDLASGLLILVDQNIPKINQ